MTNELFYALCGAFGGAVLGVFITLLCVWALKERGLRFAPDVEIEVFGLDTYLADLGRSVRSVGGIDRRPSTYWRSPVAETADRCAEDPYRFYMESNHGR